MRDPEYKEQNNLVGNREILSGDRNRIWERGKEGQRNGVKVITIQYVLQRRYQFTKVSLSTRYCKHTWIKILEEFGVKLSVVAFAYKLSRRIAMRLSSRPAWET